MYPIIPNLAKPEPRRKDLESVEGWKVRRLNVTGYRCLSLPTFQRWYFQPANGIPCASLRPGALAARPPIKNPRLRTSRASFRGQAFESPHFHEGRNPCHGPHRDNVSGTVLFPIDSNANGPLLLRYDSVNLSLWRQRILRGIHTKPSNFWQETDESYHCRRG